MIEKENTHRVYDDRTNETLFTGDNFDSTQFIIKNYDEDDSDFQHVWIETVEKEETK